MDASVRWLDSGLTPEAVNQAIERLGGLLVLMLALCAGVVFGHFSMLLREARLKGAAVAGLAPETLNMAGSDWLALIAAAAAAAALIAGREFAHTGSKSAGVTRSKPRTSAPQRRVQPLRRPAPHWHSTGPAPRSSHQFSSLGHELRTPLNAIIGFSGMMQLQLLGPLGNPRYAEYVRHIHDSGQQLLRGIEHVLMAAERGAGARSHRLQ